MDILQGKAAPCMALDGFTLTVSRLIKHDYVTIICKVITNDSSTQSLAIDPPMHYNTNQ